MARKPTPKGYKRCSRCKGDHPEKSFPFRKEIGDGTFLRYSTCARCTANLASSRAKAPYSATPAQIEHDKLFRDWLRVPLRRAG